MSGRTGRSIANGALGELWTSTLKSAPSTCQCVSAASHRFLGGNDEEINAALVRIQEAFAEMEVREAAGWESDRYRMAI